MIRLATLLLIVLAAVPAAAKGGWAERMGLSLTADLTIRAIAPASYAHVIGLQPGDQIVRLSGMTVTTPATFEQTANTLARERPAPWRFVVLRAGRETRVTHDPRFRCEPFAMIGCGDLPGE